MIPRTLFQKIWDAHVVHRLPEGPALIYVDLHLVHEVTSPQAFAGLRLTGRRVRRPDLTIATVDHNVPTGDRLVPIADPVAARQLEALERNARDSGVELFDLRSPHQGIVHVIGPELGLTQPGAGAGWTAPDETTVAYLAGRPRAPQGAAWTRAVEQWKRLRSDPGAEYDVGVALDAAAVAPQVTWGTSPGMVKDIAGRVPHPSAFPTAAEQRAAARALEYMGLAPGMPLEGLPVDRVFLGSCTNARIEDLRVAARVVRGHRVAPHVRALEVPGSQQVKAQAEREGLDRIFREAGFEWRNSGCSMCLGMNADILQPGERCASTSNRNFEGRQGAGGRTHLMSPAMAAAAALVGKLADVRKIAQPSQYTAQKASPRIEVAGDAHPADIESDEDLDRLFDDPEDSQGNVPCTTKSAGAHGGMPKFTQLKGIAAPMEHNNVDTDAIIPKQFLKTIKRSGLGTALFHAWRYDPNTTQTNPNFILNKPP